MLILKRAVPAIIAWSVGFACFAALIHALRPPVIPTDLPIMPDSAPNSTPTGAMATSRPVIELPPVLIVGRRPRKAPPPIPMDLDAMEFTECGDWRPLEQGDVSMRVRPCD